MFVDTKSTSHWPCPTIAALLQIAVVIIAAQTTISLSFATTTDSLHEAAWDRALDEAAHIPAEAYAFYAYRTLAVPHPEVYLLADTLVSKVIEELPGTRFAYQNTNPRDIDLYRRIQRGEHEGSAFSWRRWAPFPDSISDDGVPFVSWLDRRLPSCAVLLRSDSKRLSTLEAAAMRYTAYRRSGEPADSVFVVVDSQGRGSVVYRGTVMSARTGRPLNEDPRLIDPAIVFNETWVFYPLVGRDDRVNSPALARAVSLLGAPGEPALTREERRRIERLQVVASIPDERSKKFAVLVATGVTGLSPQSLESTLVACFEGSARSGESPGFVPGMLREVLYRANRLSVAASRLASLLNRDQPFATAVTGLEAGYLDLAGRRVNPDKPDDSTRSAWGYLWSYELLDISFEDIIRTRAGRGSSQALAMSAILDLAEVPHLSIEVDRGTAGLWPEQHWVLTPDGRWQFNVGTWKQVQATGGSMSRFALVLASLGGHDHWVDFARSDEFCDWDPLAVAEELARLESAMPAALISISQPLHNDPDSTASHGHEQTNAVVPLGEYARRLAADEIHWEPIPWPAIGLINPAKSELRN